MPIMTAAEYCKTVGISKIDQYQMRNRVTELVGKESADMFMAQYNKLCTHEEASDNGDKVKKYPSEQTELYDYISSSFELNQIAISYSDAQIIKESCLWIEANTSQFGNSILEVGCGSGFVSCFLAMVLPNSHITAIDRSQKSIMIANELKTRLNLENIDFNYCGLQNLDQKSFDTVASFRTIHENSFEMSRNDAYKPFSEQVELFENAMKEYVNVLSAYVKDGGNYVGIERQAGAELLAVLYAFSDSGMKVDEQSLKTIRAFETNQKSMSRFTAFVEKKTGADTKEAVFEKWKKHEFKSTESSEYIGVQADYLLEKNCDKIIDGYYGKNGEGTICVWQAVYSIKGDSTQFVLYQKNVNTTKYTVYPNNRLSEAKQLLKDNIRRDRSAGFIIKSLIETQHKKKK